MSQTAYQVRGKIAKNEPKLRIKKGDEVWLYYSEEGGGWYQWSDAKAWAHTFTSKDDALACAKHAPGPWYSMPDPATIEVVEGVYTPPSCGRFTPNA